MEGIDYLKAAGVAFAVMALTIAASFPMVWVYATFIETGHPQEYYTEAAKWIAPWSSHILGPILFFAFHFWLARNPARNAMAFAVASIVFYLLIDFGVALSFVPASAFLSLTVALSLLGKLVGALAGAALGSARRRG